jgi:hypothetical protein
LYGLVPAWTSRPWIRLSPTLKSVTVAVVGLNADAIRFLKLVRNTVAWR